jgi:hypothetical protein
MAHSVINGTELDMDEFCELMDVNMTIANGNTMDGTDIGVTVNVYDGVCIVTNGTYNCRIIMVNEVVATRVCKHPYGRRHMLILTENRGMRKFYLSIYDMDDDSFLAEEKWTIDGFWTQDSNVNLIYMSDTMVEVETLHHTWHVDVSAITDC